VKYLTGLARIDFGVEIEVGKDFANGSHAPGHVFDTPEEFR
jgi:hypothetical protein